jgi:hypothetical protein
MDRRLDPAHDRVRLTTEERATWASLERRLADEPGQADDPSRRRRGRLRRVLPWLVALLVVALPLTASTSAEAGVVCAILLTVALTTWVAISFDRLRVVLRLRPPPTDRRCS